MSRQSCSSSCVANITKYREVNNTTIKIIRKQAVQELETGTLWLGQTIGYGFRR